MTNDIAKRIREYALYGYFGRDVDRNQLFDLENDYAQDNLLVDEAVEAQMSNAPIEALRKHDAPEE